MDEWGSLTWKQPVKIKTRLGIPVFYLDSQDAKNDEKGTADENYVSYRLQRGDQSLHNQLEARSSTDNPVRKKDTFSTLHAIQKSSVREKQTRAGLRRMLIRTWGVAACAEASEPWVRPESWPRPPSTRRCQSTRRIPENHPECSSCCAGTPARQYTNPSTPPRDTESKVVRSTFGKPFSFEIQIPPYRLSKLSCKVWNRICCLSTAIIQHIYAGRRSNDLNCQHDAKRCE